MALIVEDGSIVANADSWVSRADFITYAATKGVTIADDVATDVLLRKAGQYINSLEGRLKGDLVDRDQPMSFPRSGLYLEGFYWETSEIPRQVILAQQELALELSDGTDIYNRPANPNLIAKKEKVQGAVEVEYFGKDSGVKLSSDSQAQALVNSLLNNNGLSIVAMRA